MITINPKNLQNIWKDFYVPIYVNICVYHNVVTCIVDIVHRKKYICEIDSISTMVLEQYYSVYKLQ